MPEPILVTAEKLERLRAELERLKTAGRRQVREDLARARSFGDFRENAEFDEAKRAQAALEGRIAQLERIVGRAQVVEAGDSPRITVGATVIVSDPETLEQSYFHVQVAGMCEPEAIPVTPQSPLGRALLGKTVLDEVEVETPSGKRRYKIISLTFPTRCA